MPTNTSKVGWVIPKHGMTPLTLVSLGNDHVLGWPNWVIPKHTMSSQNMLLSALASKPKALKMVSWSSWTELYNVHSIVHDVSYFAQFKNPEPSDHQNAMKNTRNIRKISSSRNTSFLAFLQFLLCPIAGYTPAFRYFGEGGVHLICYAPPLGDLPALEIKLKPPSKFAPPPGIPATTNPGWYTRHQEYKLLFYFS